MAVRQLSKSTVAQGLPRSSKFWDQVSTMGDFESIQTVTVGAGGASSVEFTSIPSTYTHLQIRALSQSSYVASSDMDAISLRFNSDTGNNYSFHSIRATGSTVTSHAASSISHIQMYQQPNSSYTGSVIFAAGVIDILDYTNTNKYTTVRTIGGSDTNAAGSEPGRIFLTSGSWRDVSAITTIKLASGDMSRGFLQYSSFALYGIKA